MKVTDSSKIMCSVHRGAGTQPGFSALRVIKDSLKNYGRIMCHLLQAMQALMYAKTTNGI